VFVICHKQEEHSTEANDAANQPETVTEQKQDQEQETAPAEDASNPPEVKISQEDVVESQQAESEVGETTQTAESTEENAPQQPADACTGNGPVDEVQVRLYVLCKQNHF